MDGRAASTPSEPPPSLPVPPSASVELVATFSEPASGSCFAILRDTAGRQRLVRNGDTAGSVKVLAVGPGTITVEADGTKRVIEMKDRAGSRDSDVSRAVDAVASPPDPTIPRYDELGEYLVVSRAQVETYLAELPQFVQQVRLVEQADADGRTMGLRIAELTPNSLAEALGFRRGDVVVTAYDEPVISAERIPKIARLIRDEAPPFVDVVVLRGGEELELTYELE